MCALWLGFSVVLEIRFVAGSPHTVALLVQECLTVFDLTKVCKSLGQFEFCIGLCTSLHMSQ